MGDREEKLDEEGEYLNRESVRKDTSENTEDMENIAVKDIPQEKLIKNSLKDELLGEHNLKHTEAAEKIVLPTAEDVKTEKNHQNILNGNNNQSKFTSNI